MFEFVYEYPESCACFCVSLVCLGFAHFFKKDFFSPLTIYCFSQSLTLGIAYLKFNIYMTDFHLKTWLIWIGAMISFFVGASCTRFVWKIKQSAEKNVKSKQSLISYNWNYHLFFSFILFFLYVLGVVGIVLVAGNLLLLTGNPSRWMTKDIDYGYWALLFNSSPLVIMFFGIASFKSINPIKRIRVISRIMLPIVLVLNVFAYPNRGTLFLDLGVLLILVNYLKKRISPVLIIFCLIIAACFFVVISDMRSQYGASVKDVAVNTALDLPYKYVANNYWNLDYAVNPPTDREMHPHTYGIDFFAGIFDYSPITGSIRNSFGWDGLFNERVQKVQGLNTTGYLWEVYKDLYMPGVIFFPFFVGMALSLLHSTMLSKMNPRNLLFYTLYIYLVGWWFFNHAYKQGIYWVWSLIIFVFTTICFQREKQV